MLLQWVSPVPQGWRVCIIRTTSTWTAPPSLVCPRVPCNIWLQWPSLWIYYCLFTITANVVTPRAIISYRRVLLLTPYIWSSYSPNSTSCLSTLSLLCTLYTNSSTASRLPGPQYIYFLNSNLHILFKASLDQMVHFPALFFFWHYQLSSFVCTPGSTCVSFFFSTTKASWSSWRRLNQFKRFFPWISCFKRKVKMKYTALVFLLPLWPVLLHLLCGSLIKFHRSLFCFSSLLIYTLPGWGHPLPSILQIPPGC